MTGPLGVGCPMWANRDWIGTYLPGDTPPGRELEAYVRVCNAVEGNTTFYGLPSTDTVARWSEATPAGFRFLFKLPREVTHDRRLRDVDGPVRRFVERLSPLRDRMGPCSVQLPSGFGPGDLEVLVRFLDGLPGELPWAVEVRHRAFHAGGTHERALNDALHDRGMDRIVLDSRALFAGSTATPEEREAVESKPRLPVRAVATADQPVVRFIGQTTAAANPPFWQPWVATVARWISDGRRPLVFLHTPDNVAAPELCRRFHAEVVALVPSLEPLPEPPRPTRQGRIGFA
jgi:uncharacterized protein YecE (DUF72 family)